MLVGRSLSVGRLLSFHCLGHEPPHDRRPRCATELRQPTQVGPCWRIESQLVRTLTLTRCTSFPTSFLGAGHVVTGSSVTTKAPYNTHPWPRASCFVAFVGLGQRGVTPRGENEVATMPTGLGGAPPDDTNSASPAVRKVERALLARDQWAGWTKVRL
jgi:hypothetical protein